MVRFIDANTGNVYNGNAPYVHWFDGKQSIGLNYDKRFIILTDKQNITIKLDSEVFYLIDPVKLEDRNKITKYDKEYYNLNNIKTNILQSEGIIYSEYYIHSFNIISQGKYVGEVLDDLYIDDEKFLLGIDFVDENEALGINLSNFGAEISNEVQRAIYEKNIDEQKVDFVLMNRKFKELLNEYINILGNKGSYKSLINALKWFEYGELTSIYEFWKRPEPNRNYLTKRDLTSIANTRTDDLLRSNSKTTFIGISCALNNIKTIDGEIVYEDKYTEDGDEFYLVNEPNPVLEDNIIMWSKEDMSLKMTLLGNFFATYFMPIHLDLLFCTIEKTIYTDTIKLVSFPKLDRFDYIDDLSTFNCVLKDVYNLTNVETFTNPDTIFGFENELSENINYRDEHLELLGVDMDVPDLTSFTEDEILEYGKAYNLQHYKGIGVVVPFNCELYLRPTDVLTKASIKVYKTYINENEHVHEESLLERDRYDIKYERIGNKVYIKFNLLMKNIGDYKVQLSFRRSDGFEYIKTLSYSVNDENSPELKMYKLVPKDQSFLDNFEFDKWIPEKYEANKYTAIELGNVADYILNPIQQSILDDVIYTQFISTTRKNTATTHTNQVFIIKYVDGTDLQKVVFKRKGTVNTANLQQIFESITKNGVINGRSEYTYTDIIGESAQIIKFMPNVYWFTMNRFGEIIKNDIPEEDTKSEYIVKFGGEQIKYYIGINTDFNIDNNITYSIKKTSVTQKKGTRIWVKDMFIPYFFKLEEFGTTSLIDCISLGLNEEDIFKRRNSEDTYKLKREDVVCFLPNLKCIRRPKDFMWKYNNVTLGEEIIPLTFRRFDMKIENGKIIPNDNRNTDKFPFPTILQPLIGRYDFRKIIYPGYYDITLNYKLDDDSSNITKTISSQFIVEKNKGEQVYKLIKKTVNNHTSTISDELLNEILTEILYKMNTEGFSETYIDEISIKNNISKEELISLLEEVLIKVNEDGYDLDFLLNPY